MHVCQLKGEVMNAILRESFNLLVVAKRFNSVQTFQV